MGKKEEEKINENIINWDEKVQWARWSLQEVSPSPKCVELLETKSPHDLFKIYFPPTSRFRSRPPSIKDIDWNNHLNSLVSMICELKYMFINDSNVSYT